jgi:hypothetical protein
MVVGVSWGGDCCLGGLGWGVGGAYGSVWADAGGWISLRIDTHHNRLRLISTHDTTTNNEQQGDCPLPGSPEWEAEIEEDEEDLRIVDEEEDEEEDFEEWEEEEEEEEEVSVCVCVCGWVGGCGEAGACALVSVWV